ncbi:hypothetical protein HZB94_04720 [Candidatus Falkowbacteria bacterium]|nr:hypothetical protein [Candidatus Falkowbacteria bacterium]
MPSLCEQIKIEYEQVQALKEQLVLEYEKVKNSDDVDDWSVVKKFQVEWEAASSALVKKLEKIRLERFDKKVLEYIEKLLDEGADKGYIAQGLAGVDSEQAWDMRERLLKEGADKNAVVLGLAGVDSKRA